MYRAVVTAIDDAGLYVRIADMGVVGPLPHVGAAPAVGTSVLVADCGSDAAPDLVVLTGGFPATSTDNAVARFDGTAGKLQNSAVTIDDNNKVSAPRLTLTDTSTHTVQMENSTSFEAKNASGTYEEYLWPRWADNTMYLNYGTGGWNIRNGTSDTRFFATSAGKFSLFVPTEGIEFGWSSGPRIMAGSGTPENVVTAPVGSLWLRTDGGTGTTLYVKESGTGNTGWIAK